MSVAGEFEIIASSLLPWTSSYGIVQQTHSEVLSVLHGLLFINQLTEHVCSSQHVYVNHMLTD